MSSLAAGDDSGLSQQRLSLRSGEKSDEGRGFGADYGRDDEINAFSVRIGSILQTFEAGRDAVDGDEPEVPLLGRDLRQAGADQRAFGLLAHVRIGLTRGGERQVAALAHAREGFGHSRKESPQDGIVALVDRTQDNQDR